MIKKARHMYVASNIVILSLARDVAGLAVDFPRVHVIKDALHAGVVVTLPVLGGDGTERREIMVKVCRRQM